MYEDSSSLSYAWFFIAAFIVVALIVIGFIFARLYKRATKDIAFVRTGLGGSKVVKDGGALVLPVLHSVIPVNLRTLRLEVERRREQAMITLDRMRVDIGVEFYVRVKPDADSISLAAQTLGSRTMESGLLRELVEAKFVDALRGVAAQMGLDDLHEKRPDFVQRVQNTVSADLEQNGLELETVSLTQLDQTSSEFFNPNNAFDAQGLTRLTEITEAKRQERNDLEQSARITIEERNLSAEQRSIEIDRETEYARLDAQRDVANRSAATKAETAEKEAEAHRKEEEAKIQSHLSIQQRKIDSDRDVRISEQDREIAVGEKSRAESAARAEAEAARAEAVRAEEEVKTVAKVAEAERAREVAVVHARQEAEQEAVGITVAANAERSAAEDKAEAVKTEAAADATAIKIKAEADEVRYRVEAEGEQAINEAKNVIDEQIIALELKLALIKVLPEVIEASMKPVEKISDIKILDLGQGSILPRGDGANGNGNGNGAGYSGSTPDSIVDALMKYRMQAPLVDDMLRELGFEAGQDLPGMLRKLAQDIEPKAATAERDSAAPGLSPPQAGQGASADPTGSRD